MNKYMQILTIGVLLTTVTACATTYKQADASVDHALLEMGKGYKNGNGFGRSTVQEYSVVDNLNCDNPQRLTSFSWVSGNQSTKRVAVGKLVHITARISEIKSEGVSMIDSVIVANLSEDACFSIASFTPKAGQTYSVLQENNGTKKCIISVINTNIKSAPDDLVIENGAACSGVKLTW